MLTKEWHAGSSQERGVPLALPPQSGEVARGARGGRPQRNGVSDDSVRARKHVAVPESKNAEAVRAQEQIAVGKNAETLIAAHT